MNKKIQLIRNDVLFQFEEETRTIQSGHHTSQAFIEVSDWGFAHHNFDESTSTPRWGVVVAIGPSVIPEIQLGTKILIEALKWTPQSILDGEHVWKTTDDFIMAYEIVE